jgi:hypothetical protein
MIEQSYVLTKELAEEKDQLLNQENAPVFKHSKMFATITAIIAVILMILHYFYNELVYPLFDFSHTIHSGLKLACYFASLVFLFIANYHSGFIPFFKDFGSALTEQLVGSKQTIKIDTEASELFVEVQTERDFSRIQLDLNTAIKSMESPTFVTIILKDVNTAYDEAIFLKKDAITYADFQRLQEAIPCLQGLSVDPQQFKQEAVLDE